MINSLFNLGRLDLNVGEYLRAERRFAEIQHIGGEIDFKEAVLDGLLFQALAVTQLDDLERLVTLRRQALEYWRCLDWKAYRLDFCAGHAEILAVLLVEDRPDLAARLFMALGDTVQLFHQSNTQVEIALFESARQKVFGQPEIPYPDGSEDTDPLAAVINALELVFQEQLDRV
jgi:hypothetical protein